MAVYHFRKTRKKYRKHLSAPVCPFCDVEKEIKPRLIKETKHHWIIPNLTSYDLWELTEVEDHLLLFPKRHVEKLSDLSEEELSDHMKLIADYESQGFNFHGRPPQSKTRSVAHQHTHLIRTKGKRANAFIFLQKPYFVFKIK